MAEITNKSVIVNKHVDTREEITKYLSTTDINGEQQAPEKDITELVDTRNDNKKGEIIVVNDPADPSLYVLDTNDKLRKIAGSGTGYDDYELRQLISKNTTDISDLNDNKLDVSTFTEFNTELEIRLGDDETNIKANTDAISGHATHISTIQGDITELSDEIKTISSDLTDINAAIENIISEDPEAEGSFKKAIADTKAIIDEYTVNNKKISENPVLTTDDIPLSEDYTYVNATTENILPGTLLTEAIATLEKTLANTTLAISAALNDIDNRIGLPNEYDEEGNITSHGYGLALKVQEIETKISEETV